MKHYNLLITFMVLCGCDFGPKERQPDKFSSENLHLEYFENNTLETIGKKQNNKKEGTWIYFDKYGEKLREIDFKNDLIDGQYVEFRQGKVFWIESFTEGKRNGLAQYYNYKCGTLKEEGRYFDNKKVELWYNYNKGNIVTVKKYDNGNLIETIYENEAIEKDNLEVGESQSCCCIREDNELKDI